MKVRGSTENAGEICRLWLVSVLIILAISILILGKPIGSNAEPPDTPNPKTWVTDGSVSAIATAGPTTYIGGYFSYVGPNTGSFAAISEATGLALLPYLTIEGEVVTVVPDGSGGWYIGGSFTRVGGIERNRIAHILSDNSLDTSWNPNANGVVRVLAVSGDVVYAGGYFASIGGQGRNYIAALDASTGAATSWNPNANCQVNALAVSGETVYAGGCFRRIGGKKRSRIAALDATSGEATSWNPDPSEPYYDYVMVNALALSGQTVYVAGSFKSIGGQARTGIAALDAVTGKATSFDATPLETRLL